MSFAFNRVEAEEIMLYLNKKYLVYFRHAKGEKYAMFEEMEGDQDIGRIKLMRRMVARTETEMEVIREKTYKKIVEGSIMKVENKDTFYVSNSIREHQVYNMISK